MRVISGSCRGKKLIPIQGCQIRPTSDRIKEAIYNILGPKIHGARVLDLFAGTGALGIEALSRGADHVVFMDVRCDTIHKNLECCKLKENFQVITADILNHNSLKLLASQPFDFVFIDPPYANGYIEQVLQQESFINLLNDNSIVIAEHGFKENLDASHTGLDIYRQKKYSKTMISFLKTLEYDKDVP
ncbi:MAG: 16S rRNA (guanine(966)-N(2))-methyltransferase RsmD [Pseudomonadota bacterium]